MRTICQHLSNKKLATILIAATCALASCGVAATDEDAAEVTDAAEVIADTQVTDEESAVDLPPSVVGDFPYEQVEFKYEVDAVFSIAIADSEAETFSGTCDLWPEENSVLVAFWDGMTDLYLAEQITDDPNFAWSGPDAWGSVLFDDIAYELVPADVSFQDVNVATGTGTATTFEGETFEMDWSITCG